MSSPHNPSASGGHDDISPTKKSPSPPSLLDASSASTTQPMLVTNANVQANMENTPVVLCNQTSLFLQMISSMDLQVHICTYLRAYDLSFLQQTCRFYNRPDLIHAIVAHTADFVYPPQLTQGFAAASPEQGPQQQQQQPLASLEAASIRTALKTPVRNKKNNHSKSRLVTPRSSAKPNEEEVKAEETSAPNYYTVDHLRHLELLLVARVLNSPEPAPGSPNAYFVSKSWCKTALKWLEEVQQQQQAQAEAAAASHEKPLSKKKQKKQDRQTKKQERLSRQSGGGKATVTSKSNLSRVVEPGSSSNSSAVVGVGSSSAPTPWPEAVNVNSDLLCCHNSLQRCTNGKSARARRRVLDKQAWKVLKRLFPDSTQLEVQEGECVLCRADAETQKKTLQDLQRQQQLKRQEPLQCPVIRRFYSRRGGSGTSSSSSGSSYGHCGGVPSQALRIMNSSGSMSECRDLFPGQGFTLEEEEYNGDHDDDEDDVNPSLFHDDECQKPPAASMEASFSKSSNSDFLLRDEYEDDCKPAAAVADMVLDPSALFVCPLVPGRYYVLPRAWCHAWRRYMKTGFVGSSGNGSSASIAGIGDDMQCFSTSSSTLAPPDAACLLCHVHQLALIPPHLEDYLYGKTTHLWNNGSGAAKVARNTNANGGVVAGLQASTTPAFASVSTTSTYVPGQGPDDDTLRALRAAGMSQGEMGIQVAALRDLERQRQLHQERQQQLQEQLGVAEEATSSNNITNNEMLDKENHVVVEILTEEEYNALVERCWPGSNVFGVAFTVEDKFVDVRNNSTHGRVVVQSSKVWFDIPACRRCDATGRASNCTINIKNRRGKKLGPLQPRPSANLEY